jgi:hypothetical protein
MEYFIRAYLTFERRILLCNKGRSYQTELNNSPAKMAD